MEKEKYVRYADSLNGDNMTKKHLNKKYIGYSRKNSNNPQDYIWSKIISDNIIIKEEERQKKLFKSNKVLVIFLGIFLGGLASLIFLQFYIFNLIFNLNIFKDVIIFVFETFLGIVEFVNICKYLLKGMDI